MAGPAADNSNLRDENRMAWAISAAINAWESGGPRTISEHIAVAIWPLVVAFGDARYGEGRDDEAAGVPLARMLTVDDADRLAQERPPYPLPSNDAAERCSGKTGWHRPQVEDWNCGNRESTCTWCSQPICRRFADPVWRGEG